MNELMRYLLQGWVVYDWFVKGDHIVCQLTDDSREDYWEDLKL